MSGRPLRSPGDAARFRKEYLDLLKLQSENNEKNLQTNRLHQSKTNDKNYLLVQHNFMNKK